MLEAHSLVRRYGDFTAVRDVSFTVQEGEILGMLGPNGAGKTTTLRMITGFLRPTEGSVRVAGHDLAAEPVQARRQIGYLPENVALYPEMRVEEYLAYRGKLEGLSRADAQASDPRGARPLPARRRAAADHRHAVEGLPPARRARRRHPARAAGAGARRADGGARPQADHRHPRAHPRAGPRPHAAAVDPHPARGRAALPARADHRQGAHRRPGHAGEPARALARQPPRAGAAQGRSAGRRRCARRGARHRRRAARRGDGRPLAARLRRQRRPARGGLPPRRRARLGAARAGRGEGVARGHLRASDDAGRRRRPRARRRRQRLGAGGARAGTDSPTPRRQRNEGRPRHHGARAARLLPLAAGLGGRHRLPVLQRARLPDHPRLPQQSAGAGLDDAAGVLLRRHALLLAGAALRRPRCSPCGCSRRSGARARSRCC